MAGIIAYIIRYSIEFFLVTYHMIIEPTLPNWTINAQYIPHKRCNSTLESTQHSSNRIFW